MPAPPCLAPGHYYTTAAKKSQQSQRKSRPSRGEHGPMAGLPATYYPDGRLRPTHQSSNSEPLTLSASDLHPAPIIPPGVHTS